MKFVCDKCGDEVNLDLEDSELLSKLYQGLEEVRRVLMELQDWEFHGVCGWCAANGKKE